MTGCHHKQERMNGGGGKNLLIAHSLCAAAIHPFPLSISVVRVIPTDREESCVICHTPFQEGAFQDFIL